MTPSQYDILKKKKVVDQETIIKASEVSSPEAIDTTLLYGYITPGRNSLFYPETDEHGNEMVFIEKYRHFHVYLTYDENKTPFINVLKFDLEGNVVEHIKAEEVPISKVIPNKRAYPSLTLFSFANLIKSKGEYIPFTTVNDSHDHESLTESNLGLKRFYI